MSERWTVFRQTLVKVSIFTCILMEKFLFKKNVFFLKNSMIDLTKTFIFRRSGVPNQKIHTHEIERLTIFLCFIFIYLLRFLLYKIQI